MVRMGYYVDQAMSIRADIENVFQHDIAQGHVETTDVLEFAEADDENGIFVLADRIDFSEESTDKLIRNMWHDAR